MRNLENVLRAWGCTEIAPIAMYEDVFKLGEGWIQKKGEPPGLRKTNPIIVGSRNGRVVRRIMFEDQFESLLVQFQEYDWAFMSGVTYWGKTNNAASQSKMYAMVFDLDGVNARTLHSFMDGATAGVYPYPNYIVLSGHGVHLYYVFEQPLSLYPNTKTELKNLKYALTDVIWNPSTSLDRNVQHQGINQAYRIPGGKTKIAGVRACAFSASEHPVSVEYLNDFVAVGSRVTLSRAYKESRLTLDEARLLYPDWYTRRIVNGEPPGHWVASRSLYDWWKRQMFDGASYGHRYFCIMALAVFAVKCGIGEGELRRDASSFVKMLNDLSPSAPFTSGDVESALECYDERYITFPRRDLEALTGVPIPEGRRNHQDRATHLHGDYWEIGGEVVGNKCRANREAALNRARAEGRIKGRPSGSGTREQDVKGYFEEHPNATVREAASELGLSKTTVQKWRPKGERPSGEKAQGGCSRAENGAKRACPL